MPFPESKTGAWLIWYENRDDDMKARWLLEPDPKNELTHSSFHDDGVTNEKITVAEINMCFGLGMRIIPNYSALALGFCAECEAPVRFIDYLCMVCRG